jgi:hypothetical protein
VKWLWNAYFQGDRFDRISNAIILVLAVSFVAYQLLK